MTRWAGIAVATLLGCTGGGGGATGVVSVVDAAPGASVDAVIQDAIAAADPGAPPPPDPGPPPEPDPGPPPEPDVPAVVTPSWGPDQCPATPASVKVGYKTGNQLADLKLKDCDGNAVALSDFCGASGAWVFGAHGW